MMQIGFPRLSIITVTYNASALIRETIENVFSVNYPDIEYIIIDGNSTDGTQAIVGEYKEHIAGYISENDNGVFNAMNKGIKMATGDWLLFLNAGDLIYDKDIFLKLHLDRATSHTALLYGNTNDTGIGIRKPFDIKSLDYGMIMACHQSMLFNKSILKDELHYADEYSFYNDYELVVRIIKKKFNIQYQDLVIASYLGGGISSQISLKARFDKYKMMYKLYGFKGILFAGLFKVGYKPF